MPRVKGERVQWVRSLGLEGLLARHLPLGSFIDQLSGIKAIAEEQLRAVLDCFIADVPAAVFSGLKELRSAGQRSMCAGSAVQEHINSKFALEGAFVGKFATLDDFYKGTEKLIGTPNLKSYRDWRASTAAEAISTWRSQRATTT